MTLSPTALEMVARAIFAARWWPDAIHPAFEHQQEDWEACATAAITAYLAQREKEGWVMVPSVPLDCLRETDRKIRSVQNRGSDTTERLVQIECLLAWPNVQGLLAAAQNGGELPPPPRGK